MAQSHPNPPIPSVEPTVDLMGVSVWSTTERDVVDHVLAEARVGRGGWVCPINLDVLRQAVSAEEVFGLVSSAEIVVADGMPIIWASHILGEPLPARVAGSTLVRTLTLAASDAGLPVFFLGGNDGVAEEAASSVRRESPDLKVATHCPPFGFESNPIEMAAIETSLKDANPAIVFVGLGFPKQERLIKELRQSFPNTWFISCGISFSFLSGEIRRAPRWVQRVGMEWIHRMFQEPKRLVRRYMVDGIPFLARLLAHSVSIRLAKR